MWHAGRAGISLHDAALHPPDSLLGEKGQVLWQSPNVTNAHGSQMNLQSAMIVFTAREPSRASTLTSFYPDKTWSLLPVLQVRGAEPRECIFFSKVRWVYCGQWTNLGFWYLYLHVNYLSSSGLLVKWFQCYRFLSIFLRVNIDISGLCQGQLGDLIKIKLVLEWNCKNKVAKMKRTTFKPRACHRFSAFLLLNG